MLKLEKKNVISEKMVSNAVDKIIKRKNGKVALAMVPHTIPSWRMYSGKTNTSI